MKAIPIRLICLLAASFAAMASQAESDQDLPFRDVGPQAGPHLQQLSAVLKIRSEQAFSSGGIAFAVNLVNDADQPMNLRNPLDFLEYTLSDEGGNAMQLPGRSQKFRINTRNPIEDQAFRVVSLSAGGGLVTELDSNSETIQIPGGSQYRMDLLIEKVKGSASAPLPIPPGKYTLSVGVSLMQASGREVKQLQAPAIEVTLQDEG